MKRNKLLLGSVSVAAIAVSAMLISNLNVQESEYETVSLSTESDSQKIDGFNEWWRAHHMNSETGEMMTTEEFQLGLREARMSAASQPKVASFEWVEQGPENVGGRTRAILVDKLDENNVYAASVSGGLFKSTNKGNSWQRVESWDAFMFITSMCQTSDGTVFVGTGDSGNFGESLGVGGRGVWYQSPGSSTWEQVPGTTSFNTGELVSSGIDNTIFFCGPGQGLKKWTIGDASFTSLGTEIGLPSGNCSEVEISRDGQVILAYHQTGSRTSVSNDGGASFTLVSGSNPGNIPNGSGSRFEYTISRNRVNGEYVAYAAGTTGWTGGVFRSSDSGNNWDQIAPGSSDPESLVNFYNGQGQYNSVVEVDPTDADRLILGGIDLYQWQLATSSPVTGGWNQLSLWFAAESSPMYVHADNHEIVFDSSNRMYIGNDGGVGISTDLGQTFIPANRGYNTIQFYSIANDGSGRLIGGTQDNGTLYNSKNNSSPLEFRDVIGGDGFDAAISFYNPKVMIGSIYYGEVRRSGDQGQSFTEFIPDYVGYGDPGIGNPNFPFRTMLGLGEFLDPNSKDTVTFLPRDNFTAGTDIQVPSMATGDTIMYTLLTDVYFDDTVYYDPSMTIVDYKITDSITGAVYALYELDYTPFVTASGQNPPIVGDSLLVDFGTVIDTILVESLEAYDRYFAEHPITGKVLDLNESMFELDVSWDTLRVQDPFQSIFLTYTSRNGGELYATRDAMRLAAAQPKWSQIVTGIGSMGNVGEIAFSADLEHIYVGTSNGLYRIDGLRDVYSTEDDFSERTDLRENQGAPAITMTKIFNNAVAGISVDPRDKGHVIIARAGTGAGGRVFESNTADIDGVAAGNGSFASISGNLSNSVACYDVLVDRADENLILVGTDFGLWFTNNGGTTWTYSSEGFGEVPVTRITQNWREGQAGCWRPGEIYISTFGRGMFASESVLSMPDPANYYTGNAAHKSNINVYPNPMNSNGTIAFELNSKEDVYIEIYSITGKLMKRVTQSGLVAGQHNVQFGVNDLSNGTYIVRLKAGDRVETAKFIKQ